MAFAAKAGCYALALCRFHDGRPKWRYCALAEGMDGQVKFVYRTDEIKSQSN